MKLHALLAQLVQSGCLTSNKSVVRIHHNAQWFYGRVVRWRSAKPLTQVQILVEPQHIGRWPSG